MNKPQIENDAYLAMCRRILKSAGKRVSDSDPDTLAELVQLREVLEEQIHAAANALNEQGYSWEQIAKPLGMSRVAAHQRFKTRSKFAA